MGRPGDRLREYREYLGLSYAKIGEIYGIPASNWEYNEKRAKTLAPEILDAIQRIPAPEGKRSVRMAWLLADDGDMLVAENSQSEIPSVRMTQHAVTAVAPGLGPSRGEVDSSPFAPSFGVTGVLPEHVQEAYKIVREALDAAKADISTMDQDQIGLVIGLAAEEVAKGNRAEARQTLLRRAEVLLGLKAT